MYTLPLEVSDWIERAHSTINHLRGEVERLKSENRDLKEYQKWAARRITSPD
jgi:FtsZ-binding cell division protein ZapB